MVKRQKTQSVIKTQKLILLTFFIVLFALGVTLITSTLVRKAQKEYRYVFNYAENKFERNMFMTVELETDTRLQTTYEFISTAYLRAKSTALAPSEYFIAKDFRYDYQFADIGLYPANEHNYRRDIISLHFAKKADFPETGDSAKLYYAADEDHYYRWLSTKYELSGKFTGTSSSSYTSFINRAHVGGRHKGLVRSPEELYVTINYFDQHGQSQRVEYKEKIDYAFPKRERNKFTGTAEIPEQVTLKIAGELRKSKDNTFDSYYSLNFSVDIGGVSAKNYHIKFHSWYENDNGEFRPFFGAYGIASTSAHYRKYGAKLYKEASPKTLYTKLEYSEKGQESQYIYFKMKMADFPVTELE